MKRERSHGEARTHGVWAQHSHCCWKVGESSTMRVVNSKTRCLERHLVLLCWVVEKVLCQFSRRSDEASTVCRMFEKPRKKSLPTWISPGQVQEVASARRSRRLECKRENEAMPKKRTKGQVVGRKKGAVERTRWNEGRAGGCDRSWRGSGSVRGARNVRRGWECVYEGESIWSSVAHRHHKMQWHMGGVCA